MKPATGSGLRDALAGASLANLLLLPVWIEILVPPASAYYHKEPLARANLDAALACLLFMSMAMGAAWRAAARAPVGGRRTSFQLGLLLVATLPLNFLRTRTTVLGVEQLGLGPAQWPVALALAVLAFAFVVRRREALFHAVGWVLLAFAPFLLVSTARAAWARLTWKGAAQRLAAPPLSPSKQGRPAVRLVWVVLDEFDYRLAFERRPVGLQMPHLDRLRTESFWATRAEAPGVETVVSIPALLSGRPIVRAEPRDADTLALWAPGETVAEPWAQASTVFAEAQLRGIAAGAAGWAHPYCRLFAAVLAECHWESLRYSILVKGSASPDGETTFRRSLADQLTTVVSAAPAAARFGPIARWRGELDRRRVARAIRHYERLRAAALRMAVNPALGLVFVHLPVPHPPGIYDRARGGFSDDPRRGANGYVDNLWLADSFVGELLAALEHSSQLGSTAVLVTSDHALRTSSLGGGVDPRVPFLLRLPSPGAVEHDVPLDTIVSRRLVIAVLLGHLRRPEDVRAWLARGVDGAGAAASR